MSEDPTKDAKAKGVSITVIVEGFDVPTDPNTIIDSSRVHVEHAIEHTRSGVITARTAVCNVSVTKEDLGDALLMVGRLAVECACSDMERAHGWKDRWQQMVNEEVLAGLDPEEGVH